MSIKTLCSSFNFVSTFFNPVSATCGKVADPAMLAFSEFSGIAWFFKESW